MKKILSLCVAMFICISIFAQTVTIGTGTSTNRRPFGMYWDYERCASLYTASEIGITGNITTLGWYIQSLSSACNGPVKIYIKDTTASVLTSDTWANFKSGATLVYDNTNTVFTSGGWQTFSLSTPFNYTANNLLVLVETNLGTVAANESNTAKAIRYTSTSDYKMVAWYSDDTPPAGNGTTGTNRPNIQISFPVGLDAGISEINNPSVPYLLGSRNVDVTIKNFGTGTLTSATIAWKVNGVLQTPFLWTGSVAANSTNGPITLGSYNFASYGSYIIKAWTEIPNNGTDLNHLNDTATKNIYVQNFAPIPFTENFDGTWIDKNNTKDVPSVYWVNSPASGNNSWRRDDEGSVGGWGSATSGTYTPAGGNGTSHSARFHSYSASYSSNGIFDAYLNFSATGDKLLKFWYINEDGDDSLDIYLSTNNSGSFTFLQDFDTTYIWKFMQVPLGSSTSETCILRFKSTSDWGDTDMGIDEVNVVIDNTTGNDEYSNNADITIFPNPNKGIANVLINGVSNADLTIYTIQGQEVYTEKIITATTSKKFDLSYLPKGIYMVRLHNEEINIFKKLVIQ